MVQTKQGDLFDADAKYAFCHCISSDFALGAGIAKQFKNKMDMKKLLLKKYKASMGVFPACLLVCTEHRYVFNLVTKKRYFNKPSLDSLKATLRLMKVQMDSLEITSLAMPRIGSGLDKLKWEDVLNDINDVFSDEKYDILIFNL